MVMEKKKDEQKYIKALELLLVIIAAVSAIIKLFRTKNTKKK